MPSSDRIWIPCRPNSETHGLHVHAQRGDRYVEDVYLGNWAVIEEADGALTVHAGPTGGPLRRVTTYAAGFWQTVTYSPRETTEESK